MRRLPVRRPESHRRARRVLRRGEYRACPRLARDRLRPGDAPASARARLEAREVGSNEAAALTEEEFQCTPNGLYEFELQHECLLTDVHVESMAAPPPANRSPLLDMPGLAILRPTRADAASSPTNCGNFSHLTCVCWEAPHAPAIQYRGQHVQFSADDSGFWYQDPTTGHRASLVPFADFVERVRSHYIFAKRNMLIPIVPELPPHLRRATGQPSLCSPFHPSPPFPPPPLPPAKYVMFRNPREV